MNKIFFKLILQ